MPKNPDRGTPHNKVSGAVVRGSISTLNMYIGRAKSGDSQGEHVGLRRVVLNEIGITGEFRDPPYGTSASLNSNHIAKESAPAVYTVDVLSIPSVFASEMLPVPRNDATDVALRIAQLESQLAEARREISSLKKDIAADVENALKSSAILKRKLNGSTEPIIGLVLNAIHSSLARRGEKVGTAQHASPDEILATLAPALDSLSHPTPQVLAAAVSAAVERDLAPPNANPDEIEWFRVAGTSLLKGKLNGLTDRVMTAATSAVVASLEHQRSVPDQPADEKPWRVVTARWSKDADGRNPVQFIKDEYGAWMKPDMTGITLSDVADNDDDGAREYLLRNAFRSFTRRSPEKKIPTDFYLPTTEQKNDALIAIAVAGGALPSEYHARMRVVSAALQRGIKLP